MRQMHLAPLAYVISGGLAGGLIVWALEGHSLSVWPDKITYPDLIAVLLTGVSLLVAILGAALAFAALWGYTQFERIVQKRTHDTVVNLAPSLLLNELREGESRRVLVNLVTEFFANEENQPGVSRAWSEERNDEMAGLREVDQDPDVG